jgi:glycosyltransferase involved in cell wall biosynthesis
MRTGDSMTSELPPDVTLLYISTVPAIIRNFLVPYALHFRGLGWRVLAAANGCVGVESIEQAFDDSFNLPLTRSIRDPANLIRGVPAVRRLIEATHPDIVHVHTPIDSFVTRVALRQTPLELRPALAYTVHGFHFYVGGNPVSNLAFQTAERIAGRWTDRLVVMNDEDETAALRFRIVPPRRLVRMPGVGIDTTIYSRSQAQPDQISLIRQQIGIGVGTPLFASVAELHPRKRHERTIEALSRMHHADAHLAIAGDGELRGQLESIVSRWGVSDRVHFLGFVGDIRPLLVASVALVLSSEREGLARVVMEALSLEVPVIASDAKGNKELVGSNSGFIVPGGDPEGMAAAMDGLIADPDLAREMGQRGRFRMADQYSLGSVIKMHDHMYAGMLGHSPLSGGH